MYGAKPLDMHEYAPVHATIRELCMRMDLPMPKLWLVNMPIANAFATGRNPNHASVALTPTIIEILEPHELRGVLAHELSHIKNRDVLVATIAATLASAISYVAYMLRHQAMWGTSDNKRRGNNPIVFLVIGLVIPLLATLIQLAISRSREYLADETGAHHCKDPLALASALEKINLHGKYGHAYAKEHAQQTATASLFFMYPFASDGWLSWFSTHPPVAQRVARLRAMYGKIF